MREDKPSSKPTTGAKATTTMRSFGATRLEVKCGSPSTKLDRTNTTAVQGAAASGISPAM